MDLRNAYVKRQKFKKFTDAKCSLQERQCI